MTGPRDSGLFVGLSTLDTVYRVAEFPPPDGKVSASTQELAGGGPAANAAVTFAALGGRADLLTALGRHPLARLVADELATHGVAVYDSAPEHEYGPAVSSVYVRERDGQRTVVSVNAHGVRATPPRGSTDLVANAAVLLVDGHHPELALASARAAHAHGVPVVLDAGSWKDVLTELLPLVDYAVCSAGFRVPGHGDTVGAVRAAGVAAVAITAGPGPVRWRYAEVDGTAPVPSVAAVDTLGAGDVFHGAFARAVARRRPVDAAGFAAALTFAAEVAALRCATPGPRTWLAQPALRRWADEMSGR
ncbi:MAG TPA: PfkB family carbohydrate kinase [Mycobacteriales bacterium]